MAKVKYTVKQMLPVTCLVYVLHIHVPFYLARRHSLPAELLAPVAWKFEIVRWKELYDIRELLVQRGCEVCDVITNGLIGLPSDCALHLCQVQLIACNGVGCDAIDIGLGQTPRHCCSQHARRALDLGGRPCSVIAARRLSSGPARRSACAGSWPQGPMPQGQRLAVNRLGVVGLRRIGRLIARRCAAFNTTVAYAG